MGKGGCASRLDYQERKDLVSNLSYARNSAATPSLGVGACPESDNGPNILAEWFPHPQLFLRARVIITRQIPVGIIPTRVRPVGAKKQGGFEPRSSRTSQSMIGGSESCIRAPDDPETL